MRRIPRDTWVAGGLLVLLTLVTAAVALQQTGQEGPPLSTASTQPNGARAFYLWLEELGYPVSEERVERFAPPPDAAAILILNPTEAITESDWQQLDPWVEAGGTLILAGENFITGQAVRHYNFEITLLDDRQSPAAVQTPLWAYPPVEGELEAETSSYFITERDTYLVHLASGEQPLVVSFPMGEGRVVLSTVTYPFTNEGLANEANAHFSLNMVNTVGREGQIWFDGWHHGLQQVSAEDIVGPTQFLVRAPAGRALLYAGVVLYVMLVLRGQRMGEALERQNKLARRSPMEYVDAIANLNQKAGHRRAVLAYYHQQIKRHLAQRYRLSADIPDRAFVDKLEQLNPGLDTTALMDTLTQLRREDLTEEDMIKAATRATDWLDKT
jgi:hypothetical protein